MNSWRYPSNTANLEYRNEPGALNESISDIMGNSIKNKGWLLEKMCR
ncbi:M4 family metallopeptidase [Paenibacillus larvae]|nr:M4 family metallopeptidase [Paenibacillus larvae]MDT2240779.1 M4 family metallopeptidase [Paenibacillus larvae]